MGYLEMSEEPGYDRAEDKHVEFMSQVLREFFEGSREDVYYSRELAVHFERIELEDGVYRPHHWVTINALRELVEEGFLVSHRERFSHGEAVFYSHRSYRYPRRRIRTKISLMNRYSDAVTCRAYGEHAELLFERAILRREFRFVTEDFNELYGRRWTDTDHDLDFAVEKDGITYGVEVKNSLDYIDRNELDVKMEMCAHLGIRPLFIVRNASTLYIDDVQRSGGYTWIFECQIYPLALAGLVEEIRNETLLPVMVSSSIPDGQVTRFLNWHSRQARRGP